MVPDIASIAASTASTPASTAASTVAPAMPDVSWVWRWIGRPISFFSAVISTRAAAGLSSPAMSLIARIWQPAFSSSFAMLDVIGEIDIWRGRDREYRRYSRSRLPPACPLRAPRRWRRAYSRPSSGSRKCGTDPCPLRAVRATKCLARHCRDNWCSRRHWRRAAASAVRRLGTRLRASAPAAPTGLRSRKRIATSKVAPPQHSSDRSCGRPLA